LATTEAPDALMEKGLLLKDLRYRFGSCSIRIPSLRERRAEIPMLVQRALERCPGVTRVDGPSRISNAALQVLLDAEYQGNVRQLGAVVEYAYLMARARGMEEIGAEHMPEGLSPPLRYQRHGDPAANRVVVGQALRRTSGNVTQAARLLGISRNALNAWLTTHNHGDKSPR
jgi:DNA-binding NtrC family response regulator